MELREWITKVDQMGELQEFKGVHWNLEIGAIADLISRKSKSVRPLLCFSEIPDYPPEYKIAIAPLSSPKRLAAVLGLDPSQGLMGLVKQFRTLFGDVKPLPPRMVTESPLFENVHGEQELNLLEFPAPFHHELDGGRYLGTACSVITRDPEHGTVNLGTYRGMVHDSKTLGLHILPGHHGAVHYDKALRRKEPFPVAIAMGTDPLLYLMSCLEIPPNVCEYDYVGGIRGQAAPVIMGEVTGLPLPADAEIVIEGICYPEETRLEGPFGEWCGYYANNGLNPVNDPLIHVKRVLHRNNPILSVAQPGRSDDFNFQRVIVRSAMVWDELEKAGVPDVKGVWCHEAGASRFLIVVSINQRYAGHARQAANIACQCHAGAFTGRYVIVVDEDIDPSNTFDVLWAFSTRSDPANDIDILRRTWSSSADPMIHPDIPARQKGLNSRALIDACRPYEWKDRFPPTVQTSPELEKAVYEKWPEVKSLIGD